MGKHGSDESYAAYSRWVAEPAIEIEPVARRFTSPDISRELTINPLFFSAMSVVNLVF